MQKTWHCRLAERAKETIKTAVYAGVDMVLANGDNPSIILDILDGKDVGTLFVGKK